MPVYTAARVGFLCSPWARTERYSEAAIESPAAVPVINPVMATSRPFCNARVSPASALEPTSPQRDAGVVAPELVVLELLLGDLDQQAPVLGGPGCMRQSGVDASLTRSQERPGTAPPPCLRAEEPLTEGAHRASFQAPQRVRPGRLQVTRAVFRGNDLSRTLRHHPMTSRHARQSVPIAPGSTCSMRADGSGVLRQPLTSCRRFPGM